MTEKIYRSSIKHGQYWLAERIIRSEKIVRMKFKKYVIGETEKV